MSKKPPDKPEGPKTRTLPEEQREPWFDGTDGSDAITAIALYDTGVAQPFPRDKRTMSIGSAPDCDFAIPGEFLSRFHLLLERRGSKVRVHDQDSKNGTEFRQRREAEFDIRPGDTFMAASIRFLAMNDEMVAAQGPLVEVLGSEDEQVLRAGGKSPSGLASPSDVLVAAISDGNILITGEPGSDQLRLAKAIHAVSLLRRRPLVELAQLPQERAQQRAILDRASRSTLVVAIDSDAPVMDRAFTSTIFSTSHHVRVIALAPSIAKASAVLGADDVRAMRHVALQPLARRRRMIPVLLDRMLGERGATLRTSDLTVANQGALAAYGWPGNLDELREVADWLVTIAREGSLRKAAMAFGISRTTFNSWFAKIGLSVPLVPGGES